MFDVLNRRISISSANQYGKTTPTVMVRYVLELLNSQRIHVLEGEMITYTFGDRFYMTMKEKSGYNDGKIDFSKLMKKLTTEGTYNWQYTK